MDFGSEALVLAWVLSYFCCWTVCCHQQIAVPSVYAKWSDPWPLWESSFQLHCSFHFKSHPNNLWQTQLLPLLLAVFGTCNIFHRLWEKGIGSQPCSQLLLLQDCMLSPTNWCAQCIHQVKWSIETTRVLLPVALSSPLQEPSRQHMTDLLVCKMVEPMLQSSSCYGKFEYTSDDIIVCLKQYEEKDNNQMFETDCLLETLDQFKETMLNTEICSVEKHNDNVKRKRQYVSQLNKFLYSTLFL